MLRKIIIIPRDVEVSVDQEDDGEGVTGKLPNLGKIEEADRSVTSILKKRINPRLLRSIQSN